MYLYNKTNVHYALLIRVSSMIYHNKVFIPNRIFVIRTFCVFALSPKQRVSSKSRVPSQIPNHQALPIAMSVVVILSDVLDHICLLN